MAADAATRSDAASLARPPRGSGRAPPASAPARPVRVVSSAVARTAPSGPSRRFVDLRLDGPGPEVVRVLAFRNHYAAFVTVKARVAASAGRDGARDPPRWIEVLPETRVMADPHFEDDACAVVAIPLPGPGVTMDRASRLRVYFSQPSPTWATVDVALRDVAAFAAGDLASVRAHVRAHVRARARGDDAPNLPDPRAREKPAGENPGGPPPEATLAPDPEGSPAAMPSLSPSAAAAAADVLAGARDAARARFGNARGVPGLARDPRGDEIARLA